LLQESQTSSKLGMFKAIPLQHTLFFSNTIFKKTKVPNLKKKF